MKNNFSKNKKFDADYTYKKRPGVAREPNPTIIAAFKKLMEASLKVIFTMKRLMFKSFYLFEL